MATQICPECKKDFFTWYIDDEISDLTSWSCYHCNYSALENEKDECICESCGKRTKTKLQDDTKKYWWCSSCNEIIRLN